MANGNDLLKDALQEIGVLAVGESPGPNMADHALNKCNRMLSGWANQGRKVYEILDETQTITASDQDYTVGDGGDWDTTWPTKIFSLAFRTSDGYDHDMDELTAKQWQEIRDKDATSSIPQKWYFDRSFPQGIMNLYPMPSANGTALMNSLKQFVAITLTGTISLPAGYEELIISHLAMKLCPSYHVKITPDMRRLAWDALNGIKQVNKKYGIRPVDNALVKGSGSTYDIYTGTYK